MSVFEVSLGPCVILSVFYLSQVAQGGTAWNLQQNGTHGFFRKARQVEALTPIDCKMKSWSSWTPCNSCTEKTLRFQSLERPSQYGGTRCVHSQWEERLCPQVGECELPDDCGEMYTCPESGRCIGQHLRCNDEWDCGSGSDENECEEVRSRETKCAGMLRIPGVEKATQGYNAIADDFVSPVLDPKYFGGVCEYIYNGEWRQLTYDAFCENLHYNDVEKYFRKPYNFLSYRLLDVAFVRLTSRVETAHFKMRSRDLMLDEDMLQSLMELPELYDFGSYARFLKDYGTHYITHGTLGGMLEYVAVINKEAMRSSKLEKSVLKVCLGVSLGISTTISEEVSTKLSVKHEKCKSLTSSTSPEKSNSSEIEDVIGYVKGGTTESSAGQLAIHDANTYRKWGKTLKYNPVVIEQEALPIYELVRFSTVADQVGNRLPLLKQAWEEYMQQFSPCRCAPCRNNGVPVLFGTACSCLCREGYSGLACERTERKGPTHGGWSCWGDWTPCLSGTRTRRRECNNPPPKDNGFPCQGSSSQRRSC